MSPDPADRGPYKKRAAWEKEEQRDSLRPCSNRQLHQRRGRTCFAHICRVPAEAKHTSHKSRRVTSSFGNWQQITTQVVESGDFARIWRLGLENIEHLTDDERVRFYAFAGGALRFFEGARLQWRHGQLDKEHWHNVEKTAIDFAATSGFKAYWAARRHWLSPEFQEWYESLSQDRAHDLYGKPLTKRAAD